jgi:RNA polymerase sigma factor for flagellar operon FliA
MASRLPAQVETQDLLSAGVLGLLDALKKYDSSKGTQFKTYAEFRIRGAILDELRSMDWALRSTREKIKRLEDVYAQLERELRRPPDEEETAKALGLGLEEFHDFVLEARGVGIISIEDLFPPGLSDYTGFPEFGNGDDPSQSYAWKEIRCRIAEALEVLTKRERLVITLYYYEELTMKEVGSVLGVSESRVSQIHSQAIYKLKARLRETKF